VIQYNYFDEVQQWYVVFQKRPVPLSRFIHLFLKREFGHCFLVREISEDKIITINPLMWGVAVQVLGMKLEDYLLSVGPDSTAILGLTADYRRMSNYIPRGLYTCVTLCKSVLGLSGLFVTPFKLYKCIIKKQHSQVVKPYVPYIN
jgi:hypothetical protein